MRKKGNMAQRLRAQSHRGIKVPATTEAYLLKRRAAYLTKAAG